MSYFVQFTDDLGKKILFTPSKKTSVGKINSGNLHNFIKEMRQKMEEADGVGLSANQLGNPIQLFIIKFEKKNERYKGLNLKEVPLQIFINPIITKASEERVNFWHGCLSAQNKPRGKIATYKWIEYEAYDEHGTLKNGRLDEMGAIIFQHEFRHLLGKCYLDFAKEFLDTEAIQEKIKSSEIKIYEDALMSDPFLLPEYLVGESIEEYAARNL